MERTDNSDLDIPGLTVRKMASGLSTIEVKTGQHTVEEVLESLNKLSVRQDLEICEIDLTGLTIACDGRKYHYDVAHAIMPFLFRDKLLRISLPKVITHEVRGVCKGLVVEPFRQDIGTHIHVPSAKTSVPIRQCIMSQEIIEKISSSDPMSLQQMQATMDVMKDVQTRDEVPYVLGNVIMRAAKHLRKLRKLTWLRREANCKANTFNHCKGTTETNPNDYDMSCDSDSDTEHCAERVEPTDNHKSCKPRTANKSSNLPKLSKEQRDNINENVLKCLGKNNHCYVCKAKYTYPKKVKKLDVAWHQYPRLCHYCASENYLKRNQRTNLTGKYAVVTGGRIKIGYHIVLKLLRDGAHVIATTRFPRDATERFKEEADFDTFKDRLKIYPLEMKSLSAVYQFIEYVKQTFPYLDILINNAAQTISRPMKFYQHLLDREIAPLSSLDEKSLHLLASTEVLDYYGTNGTQSQSLESSQKIKESSVEIVEVQPDAFTHTVLSGDAPVMHHLKRPHEEVCPDENVASTSTFKRPHIEEKDNSDTEIDDMECSVTVDNVDHPTPDESHKDGNVVSLVPHSSSTVVEQKKCHTLARSMSSYFPTGQLDADGQQLDLRPMNTWRLPIEEVPLPELLEVLAVNAVAPFILDQSLKPLMDRSPGKRRFIVNVSAMEGQFNRGQKNHFHPHTNMAKASLNMLTRTAAVGYRESGVYMTAVDTGWVTDERPYPQAKHEEAKGFILPLDIVDGAARVYDPVVCGFNNDEEPHYAVFLKDYTKHPW